MKKLLTNQNLFIDLPNKRTIKTNKMKTANKIFWNLRKFEVEYLYTDNGNFASIKEDGKEIWSLYAHTERTLNAQVTKWCKANWF